MLSAREAPFCADTILLGLVWGVANDVRVLAVLMITAGYMGAVSVVTTVKWFWFLFGMAMFLPVIYSLARTFRETVITRKDPEMIELYGKIAWLTIIMWSFYPVVWLFSEGFASFSVSFEVCCHNMCDCMRPLNSTILEDVQED